MLEPTRTRKRAARMESPAAEKRAIGLQQTAQRERAEWPETPAMSSEPQSRNEHEVLQRAKTEAHRHREASRDK